MNCPSRVDETYEHDGWNQAPPAFAADTTTRQDLNGIANARHHQDHRSSLAVDPDRSEARTRPTSSDAGKILDRTKDHFAAAATSPSWIHRRSTRSASVLPSAGKSDGASKRPPGPTSRAGAVARSAWSGVGKFATFVGPGVMVSVAYIDPGNYSTDISAGANFRFRLLFIVLVANLFAVVLQSLCVRLGTVTGLNLAEHCRAHCPSWLNILLYVFAETAIVATDIAEVIGSAIALNLLFHIPLVAGCAITLVDVLIILLLYNPTGSMRRIRTFEFLVVGLVLGVVIAFIVQLTFVRNASVGEIFRGYLPSSTIVHARGLYLSCGVLGATVMPHSLYLGSGIVQSRLRTFDRRPAAVTERGAPHALEVEEPLAYRPSLAAIRFCLKYSIAELAISLCTFALFVNSAILIVAGSALADQPGALDADLFSIHRLLSTTLAPVAGTIFALALLLSGTSASIVCTVAGQMVAEGALHWTLAPWLRRLITRSISIVPSIIIAAAVGRKGLFTALNATQVVLSVLLPVLSAPVIYFTSRARYMTVRGSAAAGADAEPVVMRNHGCVIAVAVVIWLIMTVMNVALLVLLGLGKT
ncbi:MAG: hypothetical protein M1826_007070 [Phylliscum demangeonii]|nr:MAG: hypothetical protein M1826_007070 [Phylliscum demangeonii]